MNYTTISSLGNLALANSIVTSVDIDSLVDEAMLSNYLDKRSGGIISGNVDVIGTFGGGEAPSALGVGSFAFGLSALASADYAFSEGRQTSAIGMYSHAEGSKTKAEGERSHTEGAGTFAYGWGSHSEGEQTSALWRCGHSEGKQAVAYMYCHAEGVSCIAGYDLSASNAVVQGDIASHAEGCCTSAIAKYSHAEGLSTLAGIPDPSQRPIIENPGSSLYGERNFSIDQGAHAEGQQTSALGFASHAAGVKAVALKNYSYVWNGVSSTQYNPDKGDGTYCINPNRGIYGFYIGGSSLADLMISSIDSSQLLNYLDKRSGGIVSGDVEVMTGDMSILSGNYIQTTSPEGMHAYTQNGFIQAQSTKYGDAAIGSKGYCILSVIPSANQIIVSGLTQYESASSKRYYDDKTFASAFGSSRSDVLKQMLKNPSMALANIALSDLIWSVGLFDDAFSHFGSITGVQLSGENTVFTFDHLPDFRYLAGKTIEHYKAEFRSVDGDNVLYVPGFPELGNQEVPQFSSQHVEGGSSKAVGKFSHAEGRDTLADSRYSHAEGTMTLAGGIASHTEGQNTIAYGRSSHAEGENTTASGMYAHAEGYSTSAALSCSHAEGYRTSSQGQHSHAEGNATSAFNKASHSEGQSTSAKGDYSHTEGYQTKTGELLPGDSSEGAHAEGYQTSANGDGAHSEGRETKATGNGAHAEGLQSEAQSGYSHAEGYNTRANGEGAHAEGSSAKALNNYAHAEGYQSEANNVGSHAAGFKAKANANCSWCWNGISSQSNYTATKEGSFCINPKNNISGFYIGISSLADYIKNSGSGGGNEMSPGDLENKIDRLHVVYPENYDPDEMMDASLIEPNAILAHGFNVEARGDYSIATGLCAYATGTQSIAVGEMIESTGQRSIAIGDNSSVNSDSSFAFGSQNSIDGKGTNIMVFGTSNTLNSLRTATGIFVGGSSNAVKLTAASGPSFIYGRSNQLSVAGLNIIAGEKLSSSYNWSTMLGYNAKTTQSRQFVWSGANSVSPYSPNSKSGTFNINPETGLSGFFIGKDNFIQCVLSAVQLMSDIQKTALKNALGL